MRGPLISIIIPNYNYARYVVEALDSILIQTYQDYEVIVIDDGSTDNSRVVVEHNIPKFMGRLKYVYQANQGVSAARNHGIVLSRGEYIKFLDADDILMPRALECLYGQLSQSDKDCAMVYANAIAFDQDSGHSIVQHSKKTQCSVFIGKCVNELFIRGNFIPTSSTLVKKEIFKNVGLFNDRLKVGEDLDLWLRISSLFNIDYFDQIVVRKRWHGVSLITNKLENSRAQIRIIKNILKFNPGLRQSLGEEVMRKKWCSVYFALGSDLVLNGRGRRGRVFLRRCLQLKKEKDLFKIFAYIFLSIMPYISFVSSVRRHLQRSRFIYKMWRHGVKKEVGEA